MKVRKLKDIDFSQETHKRGAPWGSTEDPKIFRKRKRKHCYCGWHSQGKESFNPDQTKHYKKNHRLHIRRLYKKAKKFQKLQNF